MRELPFSVWKARRSVVSSSMSSGASWQLGARGARRVDDLARFLEEDLAHLVVVLEVSTSVIGASARAAPAR